MAKVKFSPFKSYDYFLHIELDNINTKIFELEKDILKSGLNSNRSSLQKNTYIFYFDYLCNLLRLVLNPLYNPLYNFLNYWLEFLRQLFQYLRELRYFSQIFSWSEVLVILLDYIFFLIDLYYSFLFWLKKRGLIYGFFKGILKILASPTLILKLLLILVAGEDVMQTFFFIQINNFRPFLIQRHKNYPVVHQILYVKDCLDNFINSCEDPNIKILLQIVFNNFNLILGSHVLFSILKQYFEKIDKYLSSLFGLDSVEMHQFIKDKKNSNQYIKFLEKYMHKLDKILRSILMTYGLIFIAYLIKITDFRKFDLFKFSSAIYQLKEHYHKQIVFTLPIFLCIFFFYQVFKLVKNNLYFVLCFFLYLILIDLLS